MAIRVSYTPYDAVGALATAAGAAQNRIRIQQQQHQINMAKLSDSLAKGRSAFQAEIASLTRQEQFGYRQALQAQKMGVAMSMELQEFTRKKSQYQALLREIEESDEFSDREKEALRMQAASKYADSDLSAQLLQDADKMGKPLINKLQKEHYMKAKTAELSKRAQAGESLDVIQAEARAAGFSEAAVKALDPAHRQKTAQKELKEVVKFLDNVEYSDKGPGRADRGNAWITTINGDKIQLTVDNPTTEYINPKDDEAYILLFAPQFCNLFFCQAGSS